MAAKDRSSISPAFQWDFTHIYESDKAWEAALQEAETLTAALPTYAGTLGESAEALAGALDAMSAAACKAERVYIYAMLRLCCDNGSAVYQEMQAKADKLAVELSTACAFADPEILAIPDEKLDGFLTHPRLKTYLHRIDNIRRARAHTLSLEQEQLLASMGELADGPDTAFTMFESVDMTFPDVMDENGRPAPLTHGSYGVFRESRDPRVRRESFEKYYGEFNRCNNTLAAIYTGSVKFDTFFAKVRHYGSACEAALFDSNVPVAVYDQLIEDIHDGLPILHRYLQLRKEAMGGGDMNLYDLNAPLVENIEIDMPFEDAKVLVKKALRPLGEDYAKLLDRAFSENWIDVYENKGKTTGAFSCGLYGVHPYVLLNYTNKLDDAFTLAHELGHSMHSCYSSAAQDFENHDYQILVAEVASTVNEVLLTKYLLGVETDPRRRAYILNHFLEDFRGTVFAQALFAEFEYKAHKLYQEEGALTAEALNGIFLDLNAQYYKGAVINDLMKIGWSRIPHFYTAFYVYQYATGFCSAVSIADRILRTGDASDYLRFLTTGGSDYPLNELKIAGVDLTKPDTVRSALKVFDESLTEFARLLKTL